jgi:hypothetical protein
MFGRWMFLLCFLTCTPLDKDREMKTSFVGIPPRVGRFDIRSFYIVLVPHDSTPFLWKNSWRNKVPLRGIFCLDNHPREDSHHG